VHYFVLLLFEDEDEEGYWKMMVICRNRKLHANETRGCHLMVFMLSNTIIGKRFMGQSQFFQATNDSNKLKFFPAEKCHLLIAHIFQMRSNTR